MQKIELYKSFFEQSYETGAMPQDEYVKKVVAAVKKVLKAADNSFNMDSTIMSRSNASSRRVVSGYATLTQIQGLFTKQFPELKISMKVSPVNEFNVVVKAGERHFFTDILVPRDQLAAHSLKSLTSRIIKKLDGLDVQDFATQDDIRTNKKTRYTRPPEEV